VTEQPEDLRFDRDGRASAAQFTPLDVKFAVSESVDH
jgi:hypothetical protein